MASGNKSLTLKENSIYNASVDSTNITAKPHNLDQNIFVLTKKTLQLLPF